MRCTISIATCTALALAAPAQAETLDLSGIYPAGNDEAAALQ